MCPFALKKSVPKRAEGKGLEVNFVADTRVADGRFGNNPWLQELPDPMTKITWDNAAVMNAKTAAEQCLGTGVRTGGSAALRIMGPFLDKVEAPDGISNLPTVEFGRGVGRIRGTNYSIYE